MVNHSPTELGRRHQAILIGPGFAWILLFMLVPCALIVLDSLVPEGVRGGFDPTVTLEHYRRMVDPATLGIILNTTKIAVTATVLALLIATPTAYFIATAPPKARPFLLALVTLPFWISLLIRAHAWVLLFGPEGLLNQSLLNHGLVDSSLILLESDWGIAVGLLYAYLPFAVIPIYLAMSELGSSVRDASRDLGASAFATFVDVVLPMSRRGMVTAAILVFIWSAGDFIVPHVFAGWSPVMIGNWVFGTLFNDTVSPGDWPVASSVLTLLMASTMVLLLAKAMISRQADDRGGRILA
jgi:spermidine/putrescine transport system permease protein